jgi:hypothetical protein
MLQDFPHLLPTYSAEAIAGLHPLHRWAEVGVTMFDRSTVYNPVSCACAGEMLIAA